MQLEVRANSRQRVSSQRCSQRCQGSAGVQHGREQEEKPSQSPIPAPSSSRFQEQLSSKAQTPVSPAAGKAAPLSPLFLGSPNTRPPPVFFTLFYFPQDFYCSEEMSQDVSFSPFINIASPKCNYQGQSSTNVC